MQATEDVMTGYNAIPPITVMEMDGIQEKNAMEAAGDRHIALNHIVTQPAVLVKPVAAAVASVLTYTENDAMMMIHLLIEPIQNQDVMVVVGIHLQHIKVQHQTAVSIQDLTLSAQNLLVCGNIVHMLPHLGI